MLRCNALFTGPRSIVIETRRCRLCGVWLSGIQMDIRVRMVGKGQRVVLHMERMSLLLLRRPKNAAIKND